MKTHVRTKWLGDFLCLILGDRTCVYNWFLKIEMCRINTCDKRFSRHKNLKLHKHIHISIATYHQWFHIHHFVLVRKMTCWSCKAKISYEWCMLTFLSDQMRTINILCATNVELRFFSVVSLKKFCSLHVTHQYVY